MSLYPDIEPTEHGLLDVGDDNLVYWETAGNPHGKPALVVHGGPGSGCQPWHRRFFDPAAYRIVLFDQRGCGRSRPGASGPEVDLSSNTTQQLVVDMERLRRHLEIERWMLFGGSWGSTLSIAYAEPHPAAVSEMVLWGITTGRRVECDWLFRGGAGALFPQAWDRLVGAIPDPLRGEDVVDAYAEMLADADPEVRRSAAREWCLWESATIDPGSQGVLAQRFEDPGVALAFARLVTHYVRHDLFLEDGALLRGAGSLEGIDGVLIQGGRDQQAPLDNLRVLQEAWPRARSVIVEGAGHAIDDSGIERELVQATDSAAASGR